MSYYNQDEEPTLTGASVASGDTVAVADISAGGTIKTVTMQEVREVANRGITTTTSSTLTVTAASHAGHTIVLTRAAGIAVTLPAATGTGNKYRFVIGATVTSNSTTIKAASASDAFCGNAYTVSDGSAAVLGYKVQSGDDTVTFNGTTTGGYIGDEVIVTDIASGLFHVKVESASTGTEATPFSATVS